MNNYNIKIEFTSDNKVLKGMLHLPKTPFYFNDALVNDDNDELHTNDALYKGTEKNSGNEQKPCLVIGSHGLEGSMESAKQQLLAKILPENGFAFLRFDHRGCGKSEGDFVTDTSLSKRVHDMLQAVEHAFSLNLTSEQIFLFGSSLGGSTCISAWSRLVDKGIKPLGAVLCAAPVNSLTIERIPFKGNDRRPALPISFFENNLLFDLSGKASDLHNILIFHGDKDLTVPVENAYNLYSSAKEPKKLIILKDGDHQMSNRDDQKLFEIELIKWLKKEL